MHYRKRILGLTVLAAIAAAGMIVAVALGNDGHATSSCGHPVVITFANFPNGTAAHPNVIANISVAANGGAPSALPAFSFTGTGGTDTTSYVTSANGTYVVRTSWNTNGVSSSSSDTITLTNCASTTTVTTTQHVTTTTPTQTQTVTLPAPPPVTVTVTTPAPPAVTVTSPAPPAVTTTTPGKTPKPKVIYKTSKPKVVKVPGKPKLCPKTKPHIVYRVRWKKPTQAMICKSFDAKLVHGACQPQTGKG